MKHARYLTKLLIATLIAGALVAPIYAFSGMSSQHYCIPWSIAANGGGTMVSNGYKI
jgi:hypothetical protein